jgi:hypothetical protein
MRADFAGLTGIDVDLDIKTLVLLQLIQAIAELLDILVFSGVGQSKDTNDTDGVLVAQVNGLRIT